MSKWRWFYDLIDTKLGDLLHQHQFEKQTGKGYEEDENKDRAAAVFYISLLGTKALVDIHTRFDISQAGDITFYVVRVYVGKDILKEWLYPNIRTDTSDVNLWHGWKCATEDDVKVTFDKIASGLQRYFDENPGM